MKKIFLFVALATLLMVSCTDKRAYTVVGEFAISDFDGSTVYLQEVDYIQRKLVTLDSAQVENRQFTFKGIASGTPAVLHVQFDPQYQPALIVIEPGEIRMAIDSTMSARISGTPVNNDYQQFSDQINDWFVKERPAFYAQLEADLQSGEIDSKGAQDKQEAFVNQLKNGIYEFIKPRIQNGLGECLLRDYSYYLQPEQTIELISLTLPEFQSLEDIKKMKTRVEAQIISSVGKPFIDIHGKNFDGKEIFLSDYVGKGNVVLVDFWASWCGPCIRSLPGLMETYQKYKNKGLTIVGCSLDENMDAWKAATEKHKIPWPQFSNVKGWDEESAKAYGVNAIPATVLIGKDGIIIGRNLEANDLNFRLEELLK